MLADLRVDWRDRNLIKELYINQKAFVMVGEIVGSMYQYHSIGRGVRQRCSLSIVVYQLR